MIGHVMATADYEDAAVLYQPRGYAVHVSGFQHFRKVQVEAEVKSSQIIAVYGVVMTAYQRPPTLPVL